MLPIESLNHPLTDVLGWTLIHFLWQGTLIGVLTAIVLITMKNRSASARYVASVLGFGVMAVCPLVTAAILFAQTPTATSVNFEAASVLPTPETPHFEPTTEPPPFEVVAAETSVVSESPTTTATPLEPSPQPSLSERIDHLAPWVTAAWFVGAALLSLRLLFSWFQVIRITRFGLEPVDKAIQHTFDSLCERMGLRRIVRVFESTLIAVPATVGWLRPIVLVPATAITGLSQEQLIAVLAH
ncbi:MAG: M56 family metallopeptidase, partial [Planctomycetaceae bacterium]